MSPRSPAEDVDGDNAATLMSSSAAASCDNTNTFNHDDNSTVGMSSASSSDGGYSSSDSASMDSTTRISSKSKKLSSASASSSSMSRSSSQSQKKKRRQPQQMTKTGKPSQQQRRQKVPLSVVIITVLACSFASFMSGRLLSTSSRLSSWRQSLQVQYRRPDQCIADPISYDDGHNESTTTSDDHHGVWKIRNNNAGNKEYRLSVEERTFAFGGWHLLLELRGVDKLHLASVSDMEQSLLELIDEIEDFEDPLHYRCQGAGDIDDVDDDDDDGDDDGEDDDGEDGSAGGGSVMCFGMSSNHNHVSLYSWPEHGVVSVDVFAAGEDGLRGLIPEIEAIFGVESTVITHENLVNGKNKKKDSLDGDDVIAGPAILWQQKHRGHIEGLEETDIAALQDLYTWPIGMAVDYKVEVASVQTKFQEIKVWDVIIPSLGSVDAYKRSLALDDGSYEATHPELFRPDRIVFLDGLLQSRRSGDAQYHEALVHPILLAHKNPKRVAIIGGGEGATLREVLKHSTIEKVVMIEIDEMMVNASRQYLPEWNDCSSITGRADNCFDDPHTELHCEDAFAWFKNRFTNQNDIRPEDKFDIVIMDALDPQSMQEIVGALYTDNDFYRALNNALHHDGAIVAQIGEVNYLQDPPSMFSDDRNCDGFVDGLEALNFTEMTEYQESGCGFFDPWSFHVATKDNSTALTEGWFANEALVDLKIRQRILPTVDGKSSLRHFDGATMASYRYPSKAAATVFCRDPLTPESCLEGPGFNPEFENIPANNLFVQDGNIHSSVEYPQNSFLGLETVVHSIHLDSKTDEILNKTCSFDSSICLNQPMLKYKQEYGIKIGNGASLPPHPILKAELSQPCLKSNVTILEEVGNDPKGRPIYSVLPLPYPSLPKNDTFFGQDSVFWSDYDLARRREPHMNAAIKRTTQSIGKDTPVTRDSMCSLTRQHYAE